MSLLAEFRESKLFKLVSDISVFHWFFTVVPGGIAGVGAALHGKPIEIVLLYFFVICTLAFMALHYGGKLWAKYYAPLEKKIEANVPMGGLKHLLIPAIALLVVVVCSVVWPKRETSETQAPKSTGELPAPGASNPVSQGATLQQETHTAGTQAASTLPPMPSQAVSASSNQSTNTNSPQAKRKPPNARRSQSPPVSHGALCPPPNIEFRNNHVGNSGGSAYGIDNEGKIGNAFVGGLHVQGAPGSDSAIVKNRQTGEIDTLTVQNSVVGNEEWWLDLADNIDDRTAGNPEKIEELLDAANKQLEAKWASLPDDARNRNRAEWKEKRKQILAAANAPFNEMHICPSFIELPTPLNTQPTSEPTPQSHLVQHLNIPSPLSAIGNANADPRTKIFMEDNQVMNMNGDAALINNHENGSLPNLVARRNQVMGSVGLAPAHALGTGSNSAVANQLLECIDNGHKLMNAFLSDDNAELFGEKEKMWQDETHLIVLANLGEPYAYLFLEARSNNKWFPEGHGLKGGLIFNLVDAKIIALTDMVEDLTDGGVN